MGDRHLSDHAAGDLAATRAGEALLDVNDDRVERARREGTLASGHAQAESELVTLEVLTTAVAFHDDDHCALQLLVGGEVLVTAITLALAAYPGLRGLRVDDGGVELLALGASHRVVVSCHS